MFIMHPRAILIIIKTATLNANEKYLVFRLQILVTVLS